MDDNAPDFVRNLFDKMIAKDPAARISIYEIYGRLESSKYRKYLSSTTSHF
jgi:hypothetical protein